MINDNTQQNTSDMVPKKIVTLSNVKKAVYLLNMAITRPDHCEGIVGLTGPSGVGKTQSAMYAAEWAGAAYVQCQAVMTKKSFLIAVANGLGIDIPRVVTLCALVDMICHDLIASQRPLIVDEFDYLVDRGYADIVRDIYEGSLAPILIVGEDNIAAKLQGGKTERFHNRVVAWELAHPCTLDDANMLLNEYHPNMTIDDALMVQMLNAVHGRARRVVNNLWAFQRFCDGQNITHLDTHIWGNRGFWASTPPKRPPYQPIQQGGV